MTSKKLEEMLFAEDNELSVLATLTIIRNLGVRALARIINHHPRSYKDGMSYPSDFKLVTNYVIRGGVYSPAKHIHIWGNYFVFLGNRIAIYRMLGPRIQEWKHKILKQSIKVYDRRKDTGNVEIGEY